MKHLVQYFLIIIIPSICQAYPLDDAARTGIQRLEGYQWSLSTVTGKEIVPFGARLGQAAVVPRLLGQNFVLPENNFPLRSALTKILNKYGQDISLSVLDLSDPENPHYAGVRDDRHFIPGSTGKILVAVALLSKLQELYPNDIQLREQILRDTMISADSIIIEDSHVVPFWLRESGKLYFRPIEIGDEANLWSWLDWMISASSNAAGSAIMQQLILLEHFGRRYPVAPSEAMSFLKKTSPAAKAQSITRIMRSTIQKAGFNPANLVQTSLFTKQGRRQIPSRGSTATTKEFIRLLLKIEQGQLIDKFSSAELKRLLYITQKRIRYAENPALEDALVLFKAGSLYKCGGGCEQYEGTSLNLLSAVVGVEDSYHHYLVVISSNVLRKNSSEMHKAIAEEIHSLIKSGYKFPYNVLNY